MKKTIWIILILFHPLTSMVNGQPITQLTSTDAAELIKRDKEIVILDVRTVDEFRDGHIKGAVNLDLKQPDFQKKIDKLDQNVHYIVHCRTNNRSTVAAGLMQQKGFKNISLMTDGFIGWKMNRLPVE